MKLSNSDSSPLNNLNMLAIKKHGHQIFYKELHSIALKQGIWAKLALGTLVHYYPWRRKYSDLIPEHREVLPVSLLSKLKDFTLNASVN